ncbi:DNA ligase D [Metabacillus malikii]|uniref:DNA ligase (ATP) n=1 Tax=Metabacillus malikii TaxID=1504265 RepID=A0ABT9ZB05_9BACI|nr:DNA ligase D [Metabacillus malikii]MDQ0229449.1 bifunctional non-homologous end joining protein LigD [Metabacillus malikii]
MKPMLPTLHNDIPNGEEWAYETKYDGFRCIITITETTIQLMSRNEKPLETQFPEIKNDIKELRQKLLPYLPLTLDGEIVSLTSKHYSDFERMQMRGRLKSSDKILHEAERFPCSFVAFDLLTIGGESLISKSYMTRKQELEQLFKKLQLPLYVSPDLQNRLQFVPKYENSASLWQEIKMEDGEGIIAKQKQSKWDSGLRTKQWLKIKNYKQSNFIISGYDKTNGYFHLSVYKKGELLSVGGFSHGISSEERAALVSIMKENKRSESHTQIDIDPAIVVTVQFLSLYKGQLREPSFVSFQFDIKPDDCTWEQLMIGIAPVHNEVQFTHLDKPLWETNDVSKEQFISYLYQISDYMLPFIKNRLLTVIRFPHGMFGEAFYQKNCPEYAPAFIKTVRQEDIDFIVCNDLSTLLWLGNQLAFEFHVPFQTYDTKMPTEIVFDLDPPSREDFPLAIKAAREMKKVFDRFHLKTFPKLSGNKGLQIHIPLSKNSLTYEQTRIFTEFLANYLITSFPEHFTTERLKKNRSQRLYVDYIQHAEGKTIIAPYSLRGKKAGAFIAAPLFWEEVNEELTVNKFTMDYVLNRKETVGCPFKEYYSSPQDEILKTIIHDLINLTNT